MWRIEDILFDLSNIARSDLRVVSNIQGCEQGQNLLLQSTRTASQFDQGRKIMI